MASIAGVPKAGAPVQLDFVGAAATLGKGLLPTGVSHEILQVAGTEYSVSIVDAANPTVFVAAGDIGCTSNSILNDLDETTVDLLRSVRDAARRRLGLESDGIPKVYAVAAPQGRCDADIVGRGLSFGAPHSAYAGTAAVCTATAARIEGTIVERLIREGSRRRSDVRIAHPSGVMTVGVSVEYIDGTPTLRRATIARTARRIASGVGYVSASAL
jgi:2-methylaconitate cis-trans-isomerase PrpF